MTPWTVACQAPLSMGFPRQEYWSELPFSSPGYLPKPGIKPVSPLSPSLAGRFFIVEPLGKPNLKLIISLKSWGERLLLNESYRSNMHNNFDTEVSQ